MARTDHASVARPAPGARWVVLLAVLVSAVTAGVYAPVRFNQAWFLDDHEYVYDNPLVRRGDWEAVKAFFTEVLHPSTVSGYYQPLTMLSLAVDCRLGGRKGDPRAFNTTNLVLHTANTALLFLWLTALFRRPLPAALAALLFGLHPIHVESVTWLAQRKTTLSLCFGLMSLIAYTAYVRRRRRWTYGVCLAAFVLGCLAKPTIVALPVLMLVLDYWPLRRMNRSAIIEKWPLLALALVFGIITIISQAQAGRVTAASREHVVLTTLAVFLYDLAFYASKIAVPVGLTPYYAAPGPSILDNPRMVAGIVAGAILLVGVAGSVRWQRALPAGGMFFLASLLPASGVIKFTDAIAADRFVYLPFIGLLLPLTALFARTIPDGPGAGSGTRHSITLVAVLVSAAVLAALARKQIARWRDTDTLLTYTLARAPQSAKVHATLGQLRLDQKRWKEAKDLLHTALRLNPRHTEIWVALGRLATEENRPEAALAYYRRAFAANPASPTACNNLGNTYLRLAQPAHAVEWYERALENKPHYAKARLGLGMALRVLNRIAEAEEHLRRAIAVDPALGDAVYELARTLRVQARFAEANRYYKQALVIHPNKHEIQNSYAWMLATCPDSRFRDGGRAEQLARNACRATGHRNASYLDTLAAAYAEQGQFEQAVETAETALRLAADQSDLADEIRTHVARFRQGRAFHQASPNDDGKEP